MAKTDKDKDAQSDLDRLQNDKLQMDLNPKTNIGKYKGNKKERAVRRTVYNRYYELRDDDARTLAEEDWEMADKEFRMYFPELDDTNADLSDTERSNLHLPDAFAAIQAQMQETIDRRSRPGLLATEESDEPIQEFCNSVLKYNMNNTNYDYQWFLGKLNAAIRGTSFFKDYWRLEKRVIQDPSDIGEDGEIIYMPKEVIDIDDDYLEWKENEYIYIDEKARHIDDAIDGVEREILNIDEFRRIYGSKPGFMHVDKVVQGGETTTRSVFKLPKDINEEDVEVLHYYNRAIDAYWVVANNVVIHIRPIPYKHKELPFAVLYHYQVPGRFWGLGIPKIIHYLSEERRSIRNLNMDRQHLQINKMFIHNSQYDLDEEELVSRPNGLISVETNGAPLRDALIPLEYGDVPSSYFRTEEILLEDIRRAHGIDDRIQGVNVGGTATEAAILKESALKRVNLISTSAEMDTVIRIGRLKWNNIQFFYPAGRMERITENNKQRMKKVVKKITVKDRKFSIVNENGKDVLNMEEVRGASSFSLDKKLSKYLETSFDVTVDATVYQPTSKAIQQTKVTEMFSILLSNPMTQGVLDPVKSVSRLLEVNEENPDSWMVDGANDSKDMIMLADSENMVMAAGQPLSPTPNATEEHTLVHLMYTQTKEFEELSEEIQAIIMDHIMGEHDANPNTGDAASEMQAAGLGEDNGSEEVAPPPLPPEIAAMGPSADTSQPQTQTADLQPTNYATGE